MVSTQRVFGTASYEVIEKGACEGIPAVGAMLQPTSRLIKDAQQPLSAGLVIPVSSSSRQGRSYIVVALRKYGKERGSLKVI